MQMPKRSAREQFDRQAEHYNAQWNAWSEETLDWLLENAQPDKEDLALDVATGTGFTALAFAPHVRSVIGVDVSPGMLAQARQRAAEQGITNATFQEGSAEALPFPDAAFDLVTCRVAPHHFLSISQFLKETVRVLKPGGRFLLADTSVPDGDPEADAWQNAVETLRDPSHVRNYTPNEWRESIEAAGLKIEQRISSGNGITMNLDEWLAKAGCTPEQREAVRHRFETAPPSAVRAFRITSHPPPIAAPTPGPLPPHPQGARGRLPSGEQPDGGTVFTWQRVLVKAIKPA